MIHWFYLFSNQGSFTLSMAFLESPRKVINTNFKKKGRDKNLVNTVLSTYAYTHTVFSSQVRFEQNIHVLDKWPLDLCIFLKTGNNRRAVLDKQIDAINKYCMIHYETQIHVIFFFFRFNTHYHWAQFLTNHDWDKLRKEWTKSMPIVFNPYKTHFQDFIPTAYIYGNKFSFIFFHCLFYFLAVVSEGK